MGGLPDDVLQFVERRFAQAERQTVYGALEAAAVSTPRVMRAVLLLSNGSLNQLQHYVRECESDVRSILTNAEYVRDPDSKNLMQVRDLSLPLTDQRNVDEERFKRHLVAVNPETSPRPRRAARVTKRATYHSYLAQRSFTLGSATYLVRRTQTRPDTVSCYRTSGTVARLVSLPLFFVLEQLAERIELDVNTL